MKKITSLLTISIFSICLSFSSCANYSPSKDDPISPIDPDDPIEPIEPEEYKLIEDISKRMPAEFEPVSMVKMCYPINMPIIG